MFKDNLLLLISLLLISSIAFTQTYENSGVLSSGGGYAGNSIYSNFGITGQSIAGLAGNETYMNSFGFLYKTEGAEMIMVYTKDITDIKDKSAVGHGFICASNDVSLIGRGVCWSTSPNPTVMDDYKYQGRQPGEYKARISKINSGTTYFVRAFAELQDGIIYGREKSFTSLIAREAVFPGEISAGCENQQLQNYPNPFSDITTIKYRVDNAGFVKINIYDVYCNHISTIVDGMHEPGFYSVSFNAGELPTGIYIFRLEEKRRSLHKLMTVIK